MLKFELVDMYNLKPLKHYIFTKENSFSPFLPTTFFLKF